MYLIFIKYLWSMYCYCPHQKFRKLQYRAMKYLAQGDTSDKWRSLLNTTSISIWLSLPTLALTIPVLHLTLDLILRLLKLTSWTCYPSKVCLCLLHLVTFAKSLNQLSLSDLWERVVWLVREIYHKNLPPPLSTGFTDSNCLWEMKTSQNGLGVWNSFIQQKNWDTMFST